MVALLILTVAPSSEKGDSGQLLISLPQGDVADRTTPSPLFCPLFCCGRRGVEFHPCGQTAAHQSATTQLADSTAGKGDGHVAVPSRHSGCRAGGSGVEPC